MSLSLTEKHEQYVVPEVNGEALTATLFQLRDGRPVCNTIGLT